jgi:hypothetical protein
MACKLKNIVLYYLKFSQRCHRSFKLSGRWHCCVEWVVRSISKEHIAFMFLDCLPLKVKMTWYYKLSETTHPMIQHHVSGHLNPWVKIRASCTSKTVLYWFVAKKVLHLPNKTTRIQIWVKQTYTGLFRTFLLPGYMSSQVHVLCVTVFEPYQIFFLTCFIIWNILFQL